MAKLTKKQKDIAAKVEIGKQYSIIDALTLLKECSTAKFDESIDVSVNLGVDANKSDQNVRGAVVLPNGTGKSVRVAVFTQGDNVEKAQAAGADVVGMEDLMKTMQDGDLNYDVVIASPDAMGVVGRLGQILGPRGLMPNPKVGTVTPDVATAVKNAKAGQVRYRTDKAGIIHAGVGKASFTPEALTENITALMDALKKAKPSSAKGVYFQKISVSSTMGPGISVDIASVDI
ncbi:50S ribosomal protein L1 [Bathymodiolus septemdierum thioautotrophic gill symbiont]|uniref:Large ribosomal subunit protein uL1 n=1 Tax=endosymbiont of Bathymodiolus septemdierum str. Myojin knoll TaxID=1303921 RepID=A0A0N7KBA2_9GAMM|nr:50S ribosomal protein L1 [Bathymodiolus septemdierum thioautotrophic gill symbiont]BAS67447.1 large subunit ribosomal protein L1 [endosymbiont of Bathymodiolus septemdierum str. Myojin knoll]